MSLDIWYAAARCKVAKEQFERDLAAARKTWDRDLPTDRLLLRGVADVLSLVGRRKFELED